MIFGCIISTLLGLIRPGIRGQLLTAMVITFVLLGVGAGYAAGRFKGTLEVSVRPVVQSAAVTFLVPGAFFVYYLVINCVLALNKEHGAVVRLLI